ncbi:hypothetical protein BDZ97DRAFT_621387 [Flammula alnicola]|nr:hypothetical protein BDZ97DRAFT_621387 [Flammula alnicola]
MFLSICITHPAFYALRKFIHRLIIKSPLFISFSFLFPSNPSLPAFLIYLIFSLLLYSPLRLSSLFNSSSSPSLNRLSGLVISVSMFQFAHHHHFHVILPHHTMHRLHSGSMQSSRLRIPHTIHSILYGLDTSFSLHSLRFYSHRSFHFCLVLSPSLAEAVRRRLISINFFHSILDL